MKQIKKSNEKISKERANPPTVLDGISKEKHKITKRDKSSFLKRINPFQRGLLSRRDRKKLVKKPETSFLIKMLFSNGTCREFVIATPEETFVYMKRCYYLRFEDSWFNLTQNQYELNYFDDYPVPISREIIKKGKKAYFSVTPDNLEPLIKMEYVKALASAQELDKFLKLMVIIGSFNVFLTFIMAFFMFSLSKKLAGVE